MIKQRIKSILKSNYFLYCIGAKLLILKQKLTNKNNRFYISKSAVRIKKDIIGKDNAIRIEEGCTIKNLLIRIRGIGNKIHIGPNCYIGPDCSLWVEGNNSVILIGGVPQ